MKTTPTVPFPARRFIAESTSKERFFVSISRFLSVIKKTHNDDDDDDDDDE